MFEGQDLLYGKNMKVREAKGKGHVKLDVVTDRNTVAKRGALVLNVVIKVIKVIGKNDQADLTII